MYMYYSLTEIKKNNDHVFEKISKCTVSTCIGPYLYYSLTEKNHNGDGFKKITDSKYEWK